MFTHRLRRLNKEPVWKFGRLCPLCHTFVIRGAHCYPQCLWSTSTHSCQSLSPTEDNNAPIYQLLRLWPSGWMVETAGAHIGDLWKNLETVSGRWEKQLQLSFSWEGPWKKKAEEKKKPRQSIQEPSQSVSGTRRKESSIITSWQGTLQRTFKHILVTHCITELRLSSHVCLSEVSCPCTNWLFSPECRCSSAGLAAESPLRAALNAGIIRCVCTEQTELEYRLISI